MEIIQEGRLPSEKVYTACCASCKTQFRFKQGEATYRSDQREGDYLEVRCPLKGCGRLVTVAVHSSYSSGFVW